MPFIEHDDGSTEELTPEDVEALRKIRAGTAETQASDVLGNYRSDAAGIDYESFIRRAAEAEEAGDREWASVLKDRAVHAAAGIPASTTPPGTKLGQSGAQRPPLEVPETVEAINEAITQAEKEGRWEDSAALKDAQLRKIAGVA